VKSRWEPVVDENVTNKVEQIAKGLISSNVHSTLDPKNRIVSINLLLILVEWTSMLLLLSFHNEMLLSLDLVFQTYFCLLFVMLAKSCAG
jgi:LytS/YehU family sensor histidine kinase